MDDFIKDVRLRLIDIAREMCGPCMEDRLLSYAVSLENYVLSGTLPWDDEDSTTVGYMTAAEVEQAAKRAAACINGDMSARPLWTQDGTVAVVTREAIRRMFEIPDDVRVYIEADDAGR